MQNDIKHLLDVGAMGSAVAAFFDFLPHASALLAFIWLCIRIYDRIKYGPDQKRE